MRSGGVAQIPSNKDDRSEKKTDCSSLPVHCSALLGINKIKELREPQESKPGLPQEKAKFPLLTKAFLTIHETGCEGRGAGMPWLSLTPALALMHFRVPRGFH